MEINTIADTENRTRFNQCDAEEEEDLICKFLRDSSKKSQTGRNRRHCFYFDFWIPVAVGSDDDREWGLFGVLSVFLCWITSGRGETKRLWFSIWWLKFDCGCGCEWLERGGIWSSWWVFCEILWRNHDQEMEAKRLWFSICFLKIDCCLRLRVTGQRGFFWSFYWVPEAFSTESRTRGGGEAIVILHLSIEVWLLFPLRVRRRGWAVVILMWKEEGRRWEEAGGAPVTSRRTAVALATTMPLISSSDPMVFRVCLLKLRYILSLRPRKYFMLFCSQYFLGLNLILSNFYD